VECGEGASPALLWDFLGPRTAAPRAGTKKEACTPGAPKPDFLNPHRAAGLSARPRRTQVIVMAATNRPDLIDAAFLRPGRIDRLVYVAPPDAAARAAVLRIHLARVACAPDVQAQRRSPPPPHPPSY